MMRNKLLSLTAIAGATVALASTTTPAQAAPVAFAVAAPSAHVQTVQYYGDWRRDEWRRREAYERHRRHEEWRRRHEYRHGW